MDGGDDFFPMGKPLTAIKADIKDNVYKRWQDLWLRDPVAQHAKYFYYCPNALKARYVYKLARLELGRFVRLISGHNNLGYFQHRIGLGGNRTCRFCDGADEKFIHLLVDCPRFWGERRDLFLDTLPCSDMRWSVRALLDFSYIPGVNEAFEGTWANGDPPDVDDLFSGRESDDWSQTDGPLSD